MPRKSQYVVPEEDVDPQVEASKRYRGTAKGKAAVKRDGASASHAAAQLKYSRSAKGKEAVARWRNSSKGRAYLEEQARKRALVLEMLEREEQGLCGLCGDPGHGMEFHVNGAKGV